MTVVKREGSKNWHFDIDVPVELQHIHGPRIRRSSGTPDKKLASRLHDQLKADMWSQQHLGDKTKTTLGSAVKRWKKHAEDTSIRSIRDISARLDWWVEEFGDDRPISLISKAEIMSAMDGKMTIPRSDKEHPRKAEPATVNGYLKAIRLLLNMCVRDWDLLTVAPTIKLVPEPKGRVRALTKEDLLKLIKELPEHLRSPFVFACATGLRQANVLGLKWSDVDLERYRLLVGSDDFKNGEDFGIPLNETAMDVLASCKGKHATFVFTYQAPGKTGQPQPEPAPMAQIQHRTWAAALKRAGIEDFRWHDLRHTCATLTLEGGTDLDELQKLGGWKSREMVARYAHYRTERLRGPAKAVDKALGGLVDPRA